MGRIVFTLFALFIFVGLAVAQDEKKWEIFEWFPEGKYEMFSFSDYSAIKSDKSLEEHLDVILYLDGRQYSHIPAFLINSAARISYGKKTRIRVMRRKDGVDYFKNMDEQEDTDVYEASPGGGNLMYGWGDITLQVSGMGTEMFVIDAPDVSLLLKQGLEDGLFSKTDEKLYGMDLFNYTFSSDSRKKGNKKFSYFGVIAGSDKLLLASTKKTLKEMLET